MVLNSLLIVLNITTLMSVGYAGGVMLWQARTWWREWPPAAMSLFGGLFIVMALIFVQLTLAREYPDSWLVGRNSVLAVATRIPCVAISLLLASRVKNRNLLTRNDRERARQGPTP